MWVGGPPALQACCSPLAQRTDLLAPMKAITDYTMKKKFHARQQFPRDYLPWSVRNKTSLPPYPRFQYIHQRNAGFRVAADAALVVVDGVAGVEVQTETEWGFSVSLLLKRGKEVQRHAFFVWTNSHHNTLLN